jgi:copper chaperone CopZ
VAITVLTVPDISCEHCERAIKNALSPIEGVRVVEVNIPDHQVRVDYDEDQVDVDQMLTLLEEEDYPVAAIDGRAA